MDHMLIFTGSTPEEACSSVGPEGDAAQKEKEKIKRNLSRSIEEMELSVRATNCLKNADIRTIIDLVQKTEMDMLKTKNFGKKSLTEIKEMLESMGLRFGMKPEEVKEYEMAGE
ncbi:MAG: hypothetical protein HZA19_01335 [Nitrospirae bacterium]|nr:hypothetical protein [Nitrospirota bacterium]